MFLDRDGTINREVHHLRRIDDFELLDGAAEAIRLLNERQLRVVVVTNQAAIGRGLLSEEGLDDIHATMHEQLGLHGAHVDSIYYCPHHPTKGVGDYRVDCECRKPRTGSLRRAAQELGLDLTQSFIVGDKRSDLEAGRAAGCRTVLVRTGYGREAEVEVCRKLASRSLKTITTPSPEVRSTDRALPPNETNGALADHVADNILEAAQWILAQLT